MARKSERDPVSVMLTVCQGGVLRPTTGFDAERLSKFGEGDVLTFVEPRKDKNRGLERMYRAAISRLAKAVGEDSDALHDRLKLATGRVHSVDVMQTEGFTHTSFRPISTADMDEAAFKAFVDDAGAWVAENYGVTWDSLLDMAAEDLRRAVRK